MYLFSDCILSPCVHLLRIYVAYKAVLFVVVWCFSTILFCFYFAHYRSSGFTLNVLKSLRGLTNYHW